VIDCLGLNPGADDIAGGAVGIDMIGAALGVVFDDEDGGLCLPALAPEV
jgi:hypothetical protein